MKVINRFISISLCFIVFAACSNTPPKVAEKSLLVEQNTSATLDWDDIITKAETSATPKARKVLFTLRNMIDQGEIIKGGCWNYLDTGFTRAGVPRSARKTIFKSNKSTGPYADVKEIMPGDWLYYINHSYGEIEHSGVFIGWINRDSKEALILSYAGEARQEPGRYSVYELSNVYQIIRPQ